MFKLSLSAAVLALGLVASAAHATTTRFDDRAAFLSNLTSFDEENFDGYAMELQAGYVRDFGPFTFTGAATRQNGTDNDELIGIGLSGETNEFSFDAPITAFGVDLSDINNILDRTVVIINGEEFRFDVGAGDLFFGIISTVAISSVVFSNPQYGEYATYDNLIFGQADMSPVPLPAGIVLIGGGLLLLGGLGRRKA